jgi:hypothetical protein
VDLSPVWQAGPPLVAGLITVLVGLTLPGVLKKVTIAVGALLALVSLAFGGLFIGLAYACEAWDKHPQATWVGLISLMLLTATTVAAKSSRKHKHDDDEEDDDSGGLGVFSPQPRPPAAPAPSPVGPTLDWTDFDSTREQWARPPERTPVGV